MCLEMYTMMSSIKRKRTPKVKREQSEAMKWEQLA